MKLTMLGTGNALVTKCYNTCFVMEDDSRCFLVDGGGGNTLLTQLEKANIDWRNIKDIFVTHKHIDHLLGIIWMIRMITQHMNAGNYDGDVNLYAHDEVIAILKNISDMVLQPKQSKLLQQRIHMICVNDHDTHSILHHEVTFFDIHSTKAKQFGFAMKLDEHQTLTCCGDEPYNEANKEYVDNSTWLLHEAFCLDAQADIFHPYEKHHSTVKDAAVLAQKSNVKNLILYHTEDKNINQRKALYTKEAGTYFKGNIFVPDDLECISI